MRRKSACTPAVADELCSVVPPFAESVCQNPTPKGKLRRPPAPLRHSENEEDLHCNHDCEAYKYSCKRSTPALSLVSVLCTLYSTEQCKCSLAYDRVMYQGMGFLGSMIIAGGPPPLASIGSPPSPKSPKAPVVPQIAIDRTWS